MMRLCIDLQLPQANLLMELLNKIIDWTNSNSGYLTLILFVLTMLFGWISGIFRTLRHKPKFNIDTIKGPTLCAVLDTGMKHEGQDVLRTAISLYLTISNVGSAPASIEKVKAGFHWKLKPFSRQWVHNRVFWSQLSGQTAFLESFQHDIGESIQVFPSLFQVDRILGQSTPTYLQEGQNTNGVVYFESDGWGGCFPMPHKNGTATIQVLVVDSYGNKYKKTFSIPLMSWDEAKNYNPSFGETLATLRGDKNLTDHFESLKKSYFPSITT